MCVKKEVAWCDYGEWEVLRSAVSTLEIQENWWHGFSQNGLRPREPVGISSMLILNPNAGQDWCTSSKTGRENKFFPIPPSLFWSGLLWWIGWNLPTLVRAICCIQLFTQESVYSFKNTYTETSRITFDQIAEPPLLWWPINLILEDGWIDRYR